MSGHERAPGWPRDHGGGAHDRSADHARSSASWAKRHLRLLPLLRRPRPPRGRRGSTGSGCGRWPRAGRPSGGSTRRTAPPRCSPRPAPRRRCRARAPRRCGRRPPRRAAPRARSRTHAVRRPASSSNSSSFERVDGPVLVLGDDEQVEDAHDAPLDQRPQLVPHLSREGGLAGGELHDQVVDRAQLVHGCRRSSALQSLLCRHVSDHAVCDEPGIRPRLPYAPPL